MSRWHYGSASPVAVAAADHILQCWWQGLGERHAQKLWGAASNLKTALSVYGWITAGAVVIETAIAGAWAWLLALPGPVIFVVVVAAAFFAFATLYAAARLWDWWNRHSRQPLSSTEGAAAQRAAAAPLAHDMGGGQALSYLMDESAWGRDRSGDRVAWEAVDVLDQALHSGAIQAWGRTRDSTRSNPIDPGYWQYMGLLVLDWTDANPEYRTEPKGSHSLPVMVDLRFNRDQIERYWPRRVESRGS